MLQNPITELVEKNKSSVIWINLSKNLFSVRNWNSVRLHQRNCLLKLLQRNSPVLTSVDLVENRPITVVLTKILKQITELCLRNVVVSIFCNSFQLGLGHIEGLDDHRLHLKELGEANYISNALVNFRKTEIAITIAVKSRPVVIDKFYCPRRVIAWQFFIDNFDNFLAFHCMVKILSTIYLLMNVLSHLQS